jgi:hypothetical protein
MPNPMQLQPLTVRTLRLLLVQLEYQEMTVKELRHMLFDIEAQDEPLDPKTIRNNPVK